MYSIHSHSASVNHALTCYADFLSSVFSSPIQDNTYWIGGWVQVNAWELEEQIINTCYTYPDVMQEEVRSQFIALIIHKINCESYGAGMVYELFEARKQEALRCLFNQLILTEDEIILIKSQCDYCEDSEIFFDTCECGAEINALQMAISLNATGESRCTSCMSDYY